MEKEENNNNNTLNIHINNLNNLEEKRNRLYEISNKKMEGVLLRSRCRYEDLGEKPTKYFFLNLDSRNFTSKVISKLTNERGWGAGGARILQILQAYRIIRKVIIVLYIQRL